MATDKNILTTLSTQKKRKGHDVLSRSGWIGRMSRSDYLEKRETSKESERPQGSSPSVYKSFKSILDSQKRLKQSHSLLQQSPPKTTINLKPKIQKQETKSIASKRGSLQTPVNLVCSLDELKNESIEKLKLRKYRDLKSQLSDVHP